MVITNKIMKFVQPSINVNPYKYFFKIYWYMEQITFIWLLPHFKNILKLIIYSSIYEVYN